MSINVGFPATVQVGSGAPKKGSKGGMGKRAGLVLDPIKGSLCIAIGDVESPTLYPLGALRNVHAGLVAHGKATLVVQQA